jgi:hypothetical protein
VCLTGWFLIFPEFDGFLRSAIFGVIDPSCPLNLPPVRDFEPEILSESPPELGSWGAEVPYNKAKKLCRTDIFLRGLGRISGSQHPIDESSNYPPRSSRFLLTLATVEDRGNFVARYSKTLGSQVLVGSAYFKQAIVQAPHLTTIFILIPHPSSL